MSKAAVTVRKLDSQSVVEFAANVDDNDRISAQTADNNILSLLLQIAPESVKDRLKAEVLARCEAFRNAGTPGSQVWYPYYLQVAARVVERLG